MPEYKLSYTASQIDEKLGKITNLATVATSGDYNDLVNRPSIPAAYSHPSTHPASMISAGTFAGHVSAPQSDYMTYETPFVRNIVLLDGMWADESIVTMYCGNGDIALIYE